MQPNEEKPTQTPAEEVKKPRTRRSASRKKPRAAEENISPERVLHELAAVAFAEPDDPDGPTVKMADKLRALEMIYKHLGMADMAGSSEGVIIIDGE